MRTISCLNSMGNSLGTAISVYLLHALWTGSFVSLLESLVSVRSISVLCAAHCLSLCSLSSVVSDCQAPKYEPRISRAPEAAYSAWMVFDSAFSQRSRLSFRPLLFPSAARLVCARLFLVSVFSSRFPIDSLLSHGNESDSDLADDRERLRGLILQVPIERTNHGTRTLNLTFHVISIIQRRVWLISLALPACHTYVICHGHDHGHGPRCHVVSSAGSAGVCGPHRVQLQAAHGGRPVHLHRTHRSNRHADAHHSRPTR